MARGFDLGCLTIATLEEMIETSASLQRPEASPYSRHLPALDGVRGLAILLVMCSHLFLGTAHNAPERVIRSILSFGATGVDLFFVLSGFLITGILYDSRQDPKFFRKFYARRALRILPLYYGVLLVFAVAGLMQHRSSHGELLSLACFMQNTNLIATRISLYSAPLKLPLGHFWSLAIEEQFYLLWPLIVFVMWKRSRLIAICMVFVALCPAMRFLALQHGVGAVVVDGNTALRADSLLAGGALGLLLRGRRHDWVLATAPWLFLAITVFPALVSIQAHSRYASSGTASNAVHALSYSLIAAGYTGLLSMALRPSLACKLFSLSPMRFLGKYSYGLYVLHPVLLENIEQPLRSLCGGLHVGKGATALFVGLVAFGVSLLAAFLCYQLYERPFLRLKRFVAYKRTDSNPPGVPI